MPKGRYGSYANQALVTVLIVFNKSSKGQRKLRIKRRIKGNMDGLLLGITSRLPLSTITCLPTTTAKCLKASTETKFSSQLLSNGKAVIGYSRKIMIQAMAVIITPTLLLSGKSNRVSNTTSIAQDPRISPSQRIAGSRQNNNSERSLIGTTTSRERSSTRRGIRR